MRKLIRIIILGFLFLCVSSQTGSQTITISRVASSQEEIRQQTLENEKALDKKYAKDYQQTEEKFADRRNEDGQATSVRDFIRPEETENVVKTIELEKLTDKQKVEKIYNFVRQNFQFVPDEDGEDCWQYPGETIKRGKGDCEDLAFLLSSILVASGIPEETIRVNLKNWHVYTTVNLDGKILSLETDPNPDHFYLYDWAQCRWNRQVIEERKKM